MIFVTGGTGLVGAHLLFELTNAGKKVKALKRETSNLGQVLKIFSYYTEQPHELYSMIEWVNGDILDYFSIEEALKGVTEIYHCAAVVSFSLADRNKIIQNNVRGTSNIVNAAIENGVRKICHVSSVAALGHLPGGVPVTEEIAWLPSERVSGYSKSKFLSETEIWRGIEEDLDAVIVNPSVILGPAGWETGSPRIFKTVFKGLPFYTRGVTGYVDVKDVARAMVELMEPSIFDSVKNQRYILNAENISFVDLLSQIACALGKPAPKYFASDVMLKIACTAAAFAGRLLCKPASITREITLGLNEINRYDGSKITRIMGFSYTPISNSIKQTAAFLKNDMLHLY